MQKSMDLNANSNRPSNRITKDVINLGGMGRHTASCIRTNRHVIVILS